MKATELIQESFNELNTEACSSRDEQDYKNMFYENILRNNVGNDNIILNESFYAKADEYFKNNMAIKKDNEFVEFANNVLKSTQIFTIDYIDDILDCVEMNDFSTKSDVIDCIINFALDSVNNILDDFSVENSLDKNIVSKFDDMFHQSQNHQNELQKLIDFCCTNYKTLDEQRECFVENIEKNLRRMLSEFDKN